MNVAEDLVEVSHEGRIVKMPQAMADMLKQPPIKLTIDGKPVAVPAVSISIDPKGVPVPRLTTIYDAAAEAKVDIPILCHREYMNPVAVCRVCSVKVKYEKGEEWRLAPACYRPVGEGMRVETHHTNDQVRKSVSLLTELLLADHPSPCDKERRGMEEHNRPGDCELERLGRALQVPQTSRFARSPGHRPHDDTSLVIAVDHNSCILCDRCIRGCNDIRDNQVIGRRGKGYKAGIAFDLDTPMGNSTCVACGECMVSCPTGALMNRSVVEPEPWKKEQPPVQVVSTDELAKHPLFAGVAMAFLEFNKGAVVRRRFKKGQVICREGEFGSTAYYLEEGAVEVSLQAPLSHVKGLKNPKKDNINRGLFGLVRRFTSALMSRNEDVRDEESTSRYIHIDAPVALRYDNPNTKPVARLEKGALFGEMTCMSNYPRSATVVAAEDCVILELLRNVLYILQRGKQSRAVLDETYRRRAIDNHLRSVPIFAGLLGDEGQFRSFVDYLRPRVDLVRLNPGDVIFRQGDHADHFYLVRIGFIKVTQSRPGGEEVLAYIGPGGYFGEIGLMSHSPELSALAPPGVRVATCTSLDHADVVRIKAEDFNYIINQFPLVREHFIKVAVEHLTRNDLTRQKVEQVPLGDFLGQGLFEAQSLLVLDLEKCTRCDECTKACADAHNGVTRLIREGLRFDQFLVASSCRSCMDPYCMVGCPVGSIRRRNSREIIIEDWCIGCGKCAENCPYGNINMHGFEELRDDVANPGRKVAVIQEKATTCDLCAELDGQPSCVYACPHDAAHRMSGRELLAVVEKRNP